MAADLFVALEDQLEAHLGRSQLQFGVLRNLVRFNRSGSPLVLLA